MGKDIAIGFVACGHVEVEVVIEAAIGNCFLRDESLVGGDSDGARAKGCVLGTVDVAADGFEMNLARECGFHLETDGAGGAPDDGAIVAGGFLRG